MDDDKQHPKQHDNVFRIVPKDAPTNGEVRMAQRQLIDKLHELLGQAMTGELTGIAFCGIFDRERFGIGWVGDTPLPPLVGYVEFLQQQMIAAAYLGGIDQP